MGNTVLTKEGREKINIGSLAKLKKFKGRLNELSYSNKCVFIMMLVQYMLTLDMGLSYSPGGGIILEDYMLLHDYVEDNVMTEYIKSIIHVRGIVSISYGTDYCNEFIDVVWNDIMLSKVCKKIGVDI